MNILPLFRRGMPDGRGQSLVEFALILPILLILMLGILDFGRAVAAYNAVSNGARTGARVAIVNQDLAAITAAVEDEVRLPDVEVEFDADVDDKPVCPADECCPQIGCVVEVVVKTEYTPATPVIGNIVGNITVSSTSRMPIESVAP